MNFTILADDLKETAELTEDYLRNNLGLRDIQIEKPLPFNISYTPTFWAKNNEHNIIAVEVSNQAYSRTLDHIVMECQRQTYPVKLYYAIPKDEADNNYRRNLSDAQKRGVGVLEIDDQDQQLTLVALSLSLTGLRSIEVKEYPKKYRGTLNDAINTFRTGSPAKGCSILYEEIESMTRRIAKKTVRLRWWSPAPEINLDTISWAGLCELLRNKGQFGENGYEGLRKQIIIILGIVPDRNETNHKPKSKIALQRRDQRLRTRFESLTDIMFDLINEAKSLRF
jgi:hypothetical protein